ncbi:anaphase-promoting complex subunit 4 [Anopheles maculipalpis]|uniref:anaphase-promoting complex subunit 4 n=1 Tax=Anopheles maculipalpis TaxID=1496333 RepID=UPI002158B819|nr:anaphase-promoting complex subunit 4 [Anopheles maculipalpis]
MANQYGANRNLMKQTCNKNVGSKVEILKWSQEMDLLAFGTEKGEVLLHRLKWQKVWQLGPPEEGLKVRGIAWRPCEKFIAVGYSNGTVLLIDLETREEIHSFTVNTDITCLCWTENTDEIDSSDVSYNHTKYLPELPVLSSLSSSAKPLNPNRSSYCTKHILSILLIGTATGQVYLSALGMLTCGSIDVFGMLGLSSTSATRIREAKMSHDFKQLIVAIEQAETLNVIVLENDVLYKNPPSVLNLALKHAQILNTMSYMNETVDCIIEAWETVLLEMDNKLTNYAKDQPDGSISADFLELLMFGNASPSLKQFLLRDLTEKGLRKLGYSIELCYVTIQRLVVKPLYTAIQAMFYHLNMLNGMVRNRYYYGTIMRDTTTVTEVLRSCGALQIKAYELQQMIDASKRDFNIFFRWLYVVIVRVMDETLQENHPTITQREIQYLAQFLCNFDTTAQNIGTAEDSRMESRRKFNLERVGQYLEDKPLVCTMAKDDENGWKQLLEENECLRQYDAIYPHYEHASLLQQQKLLKKNIDHLFEEPGKVVGADFKQKNLLTVQTPSGSNVRSFAFACHPRDHLTLLAIVQSNRSLLLVECFDDGGLKAVRLHFEEKPYFDQRFDAIGTLTFQHVDFYDEDTLSLLLRAQAPNDERTANCYFMQLNLGAVREFLASMETRGYMQTVTEEVAGCPAINVYTLIDESSLKLLETGDGYKIAVSGKRNLIALLSESLKNVRIYDMDGQDEEDELLDTSSQINSSLENSQESV